MSVDVFHNIPRIFQFLAYFNVVPEGAALIRGWCLFEVRGLLEEIRYFQKTDIFLN